MPRLKPSLWAFAIFYASLVMIIGGGAKLIGYPMAHLSFAAMGLPVWFGYFIGVSEVLGGIALFLPRTRQPAAIGLAIIMAGALYFHAVYTPLIMGIPAFLVFVACACLIIRPRRPSA